MNILIQVEEDLLEPERTFEKRTSKFAHSFIKIDSVKIRISVRRIPFTENSVHRIPFSERKNRKQKEIAPRILNPTINQTMTSKLSNRHQVADIDFFAAHVSCDIISRLGAVTLADKITQLKINDTAKALVGDGQYAVMTQFPFPIFVSALKLVRRAAANKTSELTV